MFATATGIAEGAVGGDACGGLRRPGGMRIFLLEDPRGLDDHVPKLNDNFSFCGRA